MQVTSLIVNGRRIDGLENATVKITINNVSPITMTGDSVAFSATVKVPRTHNNDETFIGLNKGLLNCEYYLAQLQIASIPFTYMSYVTDTPAEFYAKVSATETEYSINLIESTDKWADVSVPISSAITYAAVQDGSLPVSAANIDKIVRDCIDFPQITFPSINPVYNNGGTVPGASFQQATIIVRRRDLTWQGDVATGSTKFVPQNYTKGRGGYKYPQKATIVLDNAQIYLNANAFGTRSGGAPAGFLLGSGEGQSFYMIVEYTGANIPSVKPTIQLQGVISAIGRSMSYYGALTDRIWIYTTPVNQQMTVYPKSDSYIQLAATINGQLRNDWFKFPDGYSPEEVIRCGEGKIIYDASIAPAAQTVYSQPADFPYTDVKKMVDDMCTAWHWRKIYKNGTLRVEPVVNADLRDGTSIAWARIHDWSDKLRSVESIDVPDEFADQYVCTLENTQFSFSNGAGTVMPVKDAYKSGVRFSYDRTVLPKLGLSNVFSSQSPDLPYIYVGQMYYKYINRHFKLFKSRVQVKMKAQLEYADVENLRLGDAYYFSQLNSYFYIKSLGEFDVSTGDCKLSLYKMDLK